MKTKLLILLTLISIGSLKAQDKFSLGLTGGAEYINYQFWGFPDSVKIDNFEAAFPKGNHQFKNLMNSKFGIRAAYSLNKICIDANLQYSSKDYMIDYDIKPTHFNNQTYHVYDKSRFRFRYLDFGANVGYMLFSESKLKVIPQVGFALSYRLSADSKTTWTDNREIVYKDFTDPLVQHESATILYALRVGVNLRYHLGEHLSIGLNPYFSQYLNQLAEKPMDRNPWAVGLSLGALYHF